MKKNHTILLAALLALVLAACSAPAAPTPATPQTAAPIIPQEPAAAVTFSDPALETLMRATLGKPEGDISVLEAQAVTRLDLSYEWQAYLPEGTKIEKIDGLESFSNLEYLDLSSHAISNVSALAGLTKLTFLSLRDNPIGDLGGLENLTNLKVLDLSGSMAEDYRPLAGLASLETLKLENSTITEITPLTSLTSLRNLSLANSAVEDYSALLSIYANLIERDFMIAATLEELGFWMDEGRRTAVFESEDAYININHSEWGAPPAEWETDSIQSSTYLEGETKMGVRYYPELKAYAIFLRGNNEPEINYVIDLANGDIPDDSIEFETAERLIREGMQVLDGENPLLAPIRFFDDSIQKAFKMSPDTLFSMPYAPLSLKLLGFFPDTANAVARYELREGKDVNIDIHVPDWGEQDYDLLFFTPISDEYRIVITYKIEENMFGVGVDDNSLGGVFFEYFPENQKIVDQWSSDKNLTVEEYLIKAFNDPAIEDVHMHALQLMEQFIREKFNLSVEELLALPTGDYPELSEE